ncbi:MAG: hypothetical protein FWE53_03270 [Firmicutes bacterium]|nr:hypothetical protein [Bacillota bacterium]
MKLKEILVNKKVSTILGMVTGAFVVLLMIVFMAVQDVNIVEMFEKGDGMVALILFILPMILGAAIIVVDAFRLFKNDRKALTITSLTLCSIIIFPSLYCCAAGFDEIRYLILFIIPILTAIICIVCCSFILNANKKTSALKKGAKPDKKQ